MGFRNDNTPEPVQTYSYRQMRLIEAVRELVDEWENPTGDKRMEMVYKGRVMRAFADMRSVEGER